MGLGILLQACLGTSSQACVRVMHDVVLSGSQLANAELRSATS